MSVEHRSRRRWSGLAVSAAVLAAVISMPAQQMVTETRDPAQPQDEDFAKLVKEWTTQPYFMQPARRSPAEGRRASRRRRTCSAITSARRPSSPTTPTSLKYYRALAAATPRVKIETIGKSDEDRELVVVWVSSDENIKNLQKNRDNLAKIADPRGLLRRRRSRSSSRRPSRTTT